MYNTHMYEDLATRVKAFYNEYNYGDYRSSDDYYELFIKFQEMFAQELKQE